MFRMFCAKPGNRLGLSGAAMAFILAINAPATALAGVMPASAQTSRQEDRATLGRILVCAEVTRRAQNEARGAGRSSDADRHMREISRLMDAAVSFSHRIRMPGDQLAESYTTAASFVEGEIRKDSSFMRTMISYCQQEEF